MAAISACDDDGGAKTKVPPARPVESSSCSPVTYAGKGRPDFLIATSTALQGQFSRDGAQVAQALKLVLAQRGWRAGDYSVGLQFCDEVARRAMPEPVNPPQRPSFAVTPRDRVLGPLFSGSPRDYSHPHRCSRWTLTQVPPGPLPLLTRSAVRERRSGPTPRLAVGASCALSLPRRTGARRPVRQTEGARQRVFGERRRPLRVRVAESFRAAATSECVGWPDMDPMRGLRPTARASELRADAVYLVGYQLTKRSAVIRSPAGAGPRRIIGPDGFSHLPKSCGAGAAADGFVTTIAYFDRRAPVEGRGSRVRGQVLPRDRADSLHARRPRNAIRDRTPPVAAQ